MCMHEDIQWATYINRIFYIYFYIVFAVFFKGFTKRKANKEFHGTGLLCITNTLELMSHAK